MKHLSSMLIFVLTLSTAIHAVTLQSDNDASSITFYAKHALDGKVNGSFGNFAGTLDWDAGATQPNSAAGSIDIHSLSTKNKMRDRHLKSDEFFDAEAHPEMLVELKPSGNNWILHIESKGNHVEVPVTPTFEQLEDGASLSLSTEINRHDVGVKASKRIIKAAVHVDAKLVFRNVKP